MFVLIEQVKSIVTELRNKGLSKEANAVAWLLESYEKEMYNREKVVNTASKIQELIKAHRPQKRIINEINSLITQAMGQLKN